MGEKQLIHLVVIFAADDPAQQTPDEREAGDGEPQEELWEKVGGKHAGTYRFPCENQGERPRELVRASGALVRTRCQDLLRYWYSSG